ncbi:MAG: hypothetical protein H7Z14_20535 [Anaerolineae bacterium]|nr:hypothetical protein [Phycisphaerae bacterium]
MPDTLSDFRRFEQLTAASVSSVPQFTPSSETPTSVQIERGIVFPHSMNDPKHWQSNSVERLIELSTSPSLPRISVVDRHGHIRLVYRPLLVYCWLQTFSRAYEALPRAEFGRWEESIRAWCDVLEGTIGDFDWPAGAIPASLGSRATEIAWAALTLHVAGKVFVRDAFTDFAADTFGRFTKRQRDNGAFFEATGSDNPETNWYHELVTLHAAGSFAVQAEDRAVATSVARATAYHAANTQPDHATNQPWALFAFIWNESTRPLAEQILHTSATQDANTNHLTLMLLADALYCLRLFIPTEKTV